jgi:cation:H+ antiporter
MFEIALWTLLFIGSYILIYFAADVFLDNLKDICILYNLSPFIIGLLVLGIDPEESIASIIAAINGLPFIAIGNVIGNSILSLSLCFALPAFFHKIHIKSVSHFYFLILYLCMIVILFSFFFQFGLLIFGMISLTFYILFIFKALKDVSKKGITDVVEVTSHVEEIELQMKETINVSKSKKIALICVGLLLIILGGEILIASAERLINLTGIAEEFFGFIIIAFVTNIEELTLFFKSIKKKSVEIGLGGMVGKIIWNLSITYGISGIILGSISFTLILIFNWLILFSLILYYQGRIKHEYLGMIDAIVLSSFLVIFIVINLIPLKPI